MPYLDQLEDDDQQTEGAQPQIASGTQLVGAGNPISSAQSAQATAKKGSGQFADLGEYLRVNQPQEFGSKLAGKVGEDVSKAGEAVQQTGQEFRNRADQSTTRENPDLISRAVGDDAATFVTDDNNVKQFQDQLNAKYTGPTAFSDASDLYSQATGAAQTAQGKATAGSSEPGRFALLDNYFGRSNYGSGEKSLDNLLVQNDPNAQASFKQIQENAKGISDQQRQIESDSNAYGAQARGTTEAASAGARAALGLDEAGNLVSGNPFEAIQSSAEQRAKQFNDTSKADYDAALTGLGQNKLSPEQMQRLGLAPGQTWGVDARRYLAKGGEADRNTAATPEEARRLEALLKLSGRDNSFLDTDQAGQYDPSTGLSFDTPGYQGAVSGAKNAIEPHVQSAQRHQTAVAQLQPLVAFWNDFEQNGGITPRESRDLNTYLAPFSAYMGGMTPQQFVQSTGGIPQAVNALSSIANQAYSADVAAIPSNWNTFLS